jgi:hypothetical protein
MRHLLSVCVLGCFFSADEGGSGSSEPVEKKGIKETLEAMQFGFASAKAVAEALPGGITIIDLFKALPVLQTAPEAIEGADEIPAELLDLSDSECVVILEKAKGYLGADASDEKVKAVAVAAIKSGLAGAQFFGAIKS